MISETDCPCLHLPSHAAFYKLFLRNVWRCNKGQGNIILFPIRISLSSPCIEEVKGCQLSCSFCPVNSLNSEYNTPSFISCRLCSTVTFTCANPQFFSIIISELSISKYFRELLIMENIYSDKSFKVLLLVLRC